MATTAELNTRNYRVDDATMDQFQNITTFVKNMAVKDSEYYAETENYYSKWLGDLLIKYVNIGLTESEAEELYDFVTRYNESVDALFDDEKLPLDQFRINMLQLFGLYKGQNYENSLLNILVLYYLKYEKNLNDYKNEISAYFFKELFLKEIVKDNDGTILQQGGILQYTKGESFKDCILETNLNKTIQNLLLDNKHELLNNQEVSIIVGDGSYTIDNNNNQDVYYSIITKTDNTDNIDTEADEENNNSEENEDNTYYYYFPEFAYDEDELKNLYLTEGYFYFDAENYLEREELKKLDYTQLFIKKEYDLSGKNLTEEEKENGKKEEEDITNWPLITESDNSKSTSLSDCYFLINEEKKPHTFKMISDGRYYLDGTAKSLDVNKGFLIYSKMETITHIVFRSSFGCFVIDINKIDTEYGVYKKETFINAYGERSIINRRNIKFDTEENITYFSNKDNNIFSKDIYLENSLPNYEGIDEENKKEKFYLLQTPNDAKWIKFTNDTGEATKSTVLSTFTETRYNSNTINNIINIFKSKEKILIYEADRDEDNKKVKLKATEDEKSLLNYGCPLVYFDLKGINNGKNNKDFLILFKELNPRYREVLKSNEIEIFMNSNFSNSTYFDYSVNNLKNKDEKSPTSVSYNLVNFLRNISSTDSDILIQDFEIVENGKTEFLTTQAFKYLYGNSYTARAANESDIITYYIDDPYKHNRYGRYNYEKEEIYSFISIYQETRDYYYKVLLNESFINEDEYKLYEKTFLSFWAIERFLSKKVENIKDINSFNLTDVKNFLTSYGMGDLSELLNLNDFYSSEDLSKRLIKNYIPLVQNKGSREVIDVLQDTFSIDQGSLEIYKTLLLKNNMAYEKKYKIVKLEVEMTVIYYNDSEYYWNGSNFITTNNNILLPEESETDPYPLKVIYEKNDCFWDGTNLKQSTDKDNYFKPDQTEFKFIKTEYNSENLYYEIINNMNSAKSYENFTENDNYWDKNTSINYLNDLNIYHETTKYLMSEFKSEIAFNYFVVRFVFIIIDYLVETLLVDFKSKENDNSFVFDSAIDSVLNIEISNSDIFEGNINLYTYLVLLRETFVRYLKTLVDDLEISSKRTFRINSNALKNQKYTKYFSFDETKKLWSVNDAEITKDFMSTRYEDKIGSNPQVELMKNIMTSLLPLVSIEDDNQGNSKITNLGALGISLYSEDRLSISNISAIISRLMEFPILMINGYNGTPLSDLTWLDAKTYIFINELFNDVFFVEDQKSNLVETLMGENFNFTGDFKEKKITLKPGPLIGGVKLDETDENIKIDTKNDIEDLQNELYDTLLMSKLPSEYDTIEKYDEFIIAGCKELSAILGTVFSIPLKESENNLLKYLQQAIEYFISYTSQLKEISYVKEYKTRYETAHIADDFRAMKTTMDIDSIYLDESLKISLDDK